VTADLRRLGKPGAYRLGRLGTQGIAALERPAPLRPKFRRRPERRRLVGAVAVLLAGVGLITGGMSAGWWFVPLLAGLAAGTLNLGEERPPKIVLAVMALAVLAGAALAWLAAPQVVHPVTVAEALVEAALGYGIVALVAALRRA
jgi:peptidoglycan/LPS O-acetylase OafA/YrhL